MSIERDYVMRIIQQVIEALRKLKKNAVEDAARDELGIELETLAMFDDHMLKSVLAQPNRMTLYGELLALKGENARAVKVFRLALSQGSLEPARLQSRIDELQATPK